MSNSLFFQQDASQNHLIIKRITDFITTYWTKAANAASGRHGDGILMDRVTKNKKFYPCIKMLGPEHSFYYITAKVCTPKHENISYILQFITGEQLPLCDEKAIWLQDGSEVTFFDNRIQIRNDNDTTILKAV